jgi:Glycosyl transferases group 1
VLFVGPPTRRKGFFDAIEAWRISQCGETGAALLLTGISEREFADSVPNPPLRVTPLGFVAKLDSFYLAADVAFLPSHHEGFPYSLLEGAVAGCLCLASDINGIRSATPAKRWRAVPAVGHRGLCPSAAASPKTSLHDNRQWIVSPSMATMATTRSNDPCRHGARIYHIADDGVVSTRRLVEILAEGLGVSPRPVSIPRWLAVGGATLLGNEFSLELVVRQHLNIYRELLGERWPG